ncbi:putative nuclease HARBI1 [Nothobranchius furzeri]|uniref:putative nuclease HARBI1 n=1 Tax=Nothobranchius furzeri TaxID=105023 RepID=UPI00390464A4
MYRWQRHFLLLRLRRNNEQTRPRYCRINLSVPVLDRSFNQQDPRPDIRLSRESLSVLLNLLNQDRSRGWGATIETLVFLFWLASGASYRVVSRAFGIPRSTVHRIVHRVTEEVVAIRHQVIHLPKTPEDLEVVSQVFAGLFSKLQVPSTAATSGSSLQAALMVTVTGTGNCSPLSSCRLCVTIRATSLTPTWAGRGRCTTPGCSATARCTGSQSVYPPPGHFILADGGYPCLQSPLPLISPYKRGNQGVAAQRFNSHHSKARSVIERAFGMMKTRFRAIFLQALEVHPTFVPHVVTACAILHNICLSAGDFVVAEDEPEEDGGDDEGEAGLEDASGARWRDQLCCEVSALEEVPLDHDYY